MAFIFGGDTGTTYEDMKRKQALANQVLGQRRNSRNVGEGISSIANALIYRGANKQAEKIKGQLDEKWKTQIEGMGLDPARAAIYSSLPHEQRQGALLGYMNQQDAQRAAAARSGAAASRQAQKDAEAQAQQQAIIAAIQPRQQPRAGVQMGPTMEAANAGAQSGSDLGTLQTEQVQRSPNEMLTQMLMGGVPAKDAFSTVEAFQGLQPEQPNPTDDIREYEFAKSQGFEGTFTDFMTGMRRAGATNITNSVGGQGEVGTIPQGYELFTDQNTGARSLRPIAGGPEDTTSQDSRRQSNMDTASDSVLTAAQFARDAAENRLIGGVGGAMAAYNPSSQNAEVYRQVDVLKSNAKVSNLQAMRDASKTGAALGAVTAPELKMLEDQAGALDPASPNFVRDLDLYERTLLRTIHGKEAGDAIFEASRQNDVDSDIPTFNAETGQWE